MKLTGSKSAVVNSNAESSSQLQPQPSDDETAADMKHSEGGADANAAAARKLVEDETTAFNERHRRRGKNRLSSSSNRIQKGRGEEYRKYSRKKCGSLQQRRQRTQVTYGGPKTIKETRLKMKTTRSWALIEERRKIKKED